MKIEIVGSMPVVCHESSIVHLIEDNGRRMAEEKKMKDRVYRQDNQGNHDI